MDWESIAAGLLHDTVEDTDVVTFERIEKEFGATVRRIVEGETKVPLIFKAKCLYFFAHPLKLDHCLVWSDKLHICFIYFYTKVSKLGKLQCSNENNSVQDVKADDLRQMFLAMTEEVSFLFISKAMCANV